LQSQRGQSQRAPARTVATWSVTWSVRRPWRLAPMEATAVRYRSDLTNSGRVYRAHTSASDSRSLLAHNPLTHRNTAVISSPFESCTPSAHFGTESAGRDAPTAVELRAAHETALAYPDALVLRVEAGYAGAGTRTLRSASVPLARGRRRRRCARGWTPVGCRGNTRAQHVPANPAAAARVPD